MNILGVTHYEGQRTELFKEWSERNGHTFYVCAPFKGEFVNKEFDMLVVLGGGQRSVYLDKDPYLYDEVRLIQQAINDGKKVIGFCLGAQLIGIALGADALLSPHKEVGIFEIHLTENAKSDPLICDIEQDFKCTLWHNDMMGVLEDSVVLAESEGCPRQIVRYKDNIYGFQFHPEMNLDDIMDIIDLIPGDLGHSKYRKGKKNFLNHDFSGSNQMAVKILDRLASS